jgi:hypothetical protein
MADGGIDPLALLCAPLTPGAFFEQHWGRATFTAKGASDRFVPVYDLQRFDARTFDGPVDTATVDAQGRQRQQRIDASRASASFDAGMTLCADVTRTPELAAFLDALSDRLEVGRGGFAKLYASPPGAGFAPHFDPDHVFVLQLRGQKRWWFGDTPALPFATCGGKVLEGAAVHTFPRDGQPVVADDGAPIPAPSREGLLDVLLCPGDVLYLPPGTWHETQAQQESVAVSLSPPRVTTSQVLLSTIQAALDRVEGFRADVLPHPDERVAGAVADSVARQLGSACGALAGWLSQLPASSVVQSWCARVYRRGGESPPGEPVQLRRSHVLRHTGARGLTYVAAPESPGAPPVVFIYHRGQEWVFPAEAERFVRELAGHPSFRADAALSWDDGLSWDDARDVLEQLVGCGILQREG